MCISTGLLIDYLNGDHSYTLAVVLCCGQQNVTLEGEIITKEIGNCKIGYVRNVPATVNCTYKQDNLIFSKTDIVNGKQNKIAFDIWLDLKRLIFQMQSNSCNFISYSHRS